jgi:hypothetical protein
MGFPRRVEPEQLDSLPADDAAAIQSRRDLQRLTVVMGQPAAIARPLAAHGATRPIRRLVDLGGGDGTLLLQVARRLAPRVPGVRGVVVDRQMLVSATTREAFGGLGWDLEPAIADAFEWLRADRPQAGTVVIANLFLHHLREAPLSALLVQVAAKAELFVACEPRRSRLTLGASALVGWIGCNAVTRHDATTSVRAGFTGRELSRLWPAGEDWQIEEGPTGLFSHAFVASRRGG